MAHIADFMVETRSSVGLNNYIAREVSPNSPRDAGARTVTPTNEKEAYVWRMHQPSEPRKYQLFPAKEKLSIAAGRKSPDPETVLASTISQGEKDRPTPGGLLRTKTKEPPTLIRRRKVSVPELGPMTTVQEIAMDSPTIPGRPPLHERSISAPGNSWRQHVIAESMLSCITGPALDENAELAMSDTTTSTTGLASEESSQIATPRQGSPRLPLSPKILAPLVIASTSAPPPQRVFLQNSTSRIMSGSTPPEVPPKSARMKEGSPYSRSAPFTASTTSLTNATTSVSNTPNSAPDGRSSPKPWSAGPSPTPNALGHTRGQSDTSQRHGHAIGHRRGESETSIMDRGRPKKRADGTPTKEAVKTSSKTTSSAEEQRAFETLPPGHRPSEALGLLATSEIEVLRKQAIGQASRFEVLSSRDVENLSRELRGLDERCEYLRKTHRSLRSGRRNLHDRICSYLRSPRVARFSHESILKQEEALSELDASIDDWVSKLEQAENRRTRVRQKLLEHVAAALILPPLTHEDTKTTGMMEREVSTGPTGENTPPRSPTKSHSPQRLAAPVQVDTADEQGRRSVESIRIYADSDVYALLADVEEEITRMGEGGHHEPSQDAALGSVLMLNAATFSPPKPIGYGTPAF